jgi:hypothetical protein
MKTKYPTGKTDEIRWDTISGRQFLRLTGITAAGVLTSHCTSKETSLEPGTPLALVDGTLIDGTGANAMPDAAIIIRDDRITAVGLRPEIKIPDNSYVVNVHAKTILPHT